MPAPSTKPDHEGKQPGNRSAAVINMELPRPMAAGPAAAVRAMSTAGATNGQILAYLDANAVPIPTKYADPATPVGKPAPCVPAVRVHQGTPSKWCLDGQVMDLLAILPAMGVAEPEKSKAKHRSS